MYGAWPVNPQMATLSGVYRRIMRVDIQGAFGKAIKLRRTELDFSQEELADASKLARSFVSGVERGQSNASTASVWKLALALECMPSDLWLSAERIFQSAR